MASTDTMTWLREANFDGWSFDGDHLNGINAYLYRKGPEHEFLDAELEALRKAFYAAATTFRTHIATNTFFVGQGRYRIPEDWEQKQPEHYRQVVKEAHAGADLVCKPTTTSSAPLDGSSRHDLSGNRRCDRAGAPSCSRPRCSRRRLGRAERVLDFFTSQINNDNIRSKAYLNATRRFAMWCDQRASASSPA